LRPSFKGRTSVTACPRHTRSCLAGPSILTAAMRPRHITGRRQAEGAEMRQQLEPFITVRKGDVSAQRRG